MIKLKHIQYVTHLVGRILNKEEQRFLAGDIENWLLTQKNIQVEVEVI